MFSRRPAIHVKIGGAEGNRTPICTMPLCHPTVERRPLNYMKSFTTTCFTSGRNRICRTFTTKTTFPNTIFISPVTTYTCAFTMGTDNNLFIIYVDYIHKSGRDGVIRTPEAFAPAPKAGPVPSYGLRPD